MHEGLRYSHANYGMGNLFFKQMFGLKIEKTQFKFLKDMKIYQIYS